MTDFQTATQLGALLAKDYARGFLELLVTYRDISASEAASRLNLHIRTAQDYLDGLAALGILSKEEARENKRPYFRYSLQQEHIVMDLDLASLAAAQPTGALTSRIRERGNSGARFATGRSDHYIHHVAVWTGEGRERTEKRISLTAPQGQFLYHLPFPTAEPLSIAEIMKKADVDDALAPEILDIVQVLQQHGVIEAQHAAPLECASGACAF
jgi:predicted transcriptional regulator